MNVIHFVITTEGKNYFSKTRTKSKKIKLKEIIQLKTFILCEYLNHSENNEHKALVNL